MGLGYGASVAIGSPRRDLNGVRSGVQVELPFSSESPGTGGASPHLDPQGVGVLRRLRRPHLKLDSGHRGGDVGGVRVIGAIAERPADIAEVGLRLPRRPILDAEVIDLCLGCRDPAQRTDQCEGRREQPPPPLTSGNYRRFLRDRRRGGHLLDCTKGRGDVMVAFLMGARGSDV